MEEKWVFLSGRKQQSYIVELHHHFLLPSLCTDGFNSSFPRPALSWCPWTSHHAVKFDCGCKNFTSWLSCSTSAQTRSEESSEKISKKGFSTNFVFFNEQKLQEAGKLKVSVSWAQWVKQRRCLRTTRRENHVSARVACQEEQINKDLHS